MRVTYGRAPAAGSGSSNGAATSCWELLLRPRRPGTDQGPRCPRCVLPASVTWPELLRRGSDVLLRCHTVLPGDDGKELGGLRGARLRWDTPAASCAAPTARPHPHGRHVSLRRPRQEPHGRRAGVTYCTAVLPVWGHPRRDPVPFAVAPGHTLWFSGSSRPSPWKCGARSPAPISSLDPECPPWAQMAECGVRPGTADALPPEAMPGSCAPHTRGGRRCTCLPLEALLRLPGPRLPLLRPPRSLAPFWTLPAGRDRGRGTGAAPTAAALPVVGVRVGGRGSPAPPSTSQPTCPGGIGAAALGKCW